MSRAVVAVTMPPSYTLARSGPVRTAIRSDLLPALASWLSAPVFEPPPGSAPLPGGRGATYRTTLPDGRRIVIRNYRRGGVLARFVRESYLGWSPRPLRELIVTNEARRRGVAVAEVLAARVEGRLVYRGALVTAEVPSACTLVEALQAASDGAARCRLAAVAGRAVASLHRAGVVHADLNATNILVHPAEGTLAVTFVDFDRARLRPGPLGAGARQRSLRRLARSFAKLDRAGAFSGPAEQAAFCAAYEERRCVP